MASKKYMMMLGLLGLISTAGFAQDATPAATDTSLYAGTPAGDSWIYNPNYFSNTTQHNAFTSRTAAYPSHPKDMWELGIGVGPTLFFSPINPKVGEAAGISLRKALGSVVSLRAQYNFGYYYGQDWRVRPVSEAPISVQQALAAHGNPSTYVANFKDQIQQLSLDALFSLNTISNYRGNPKVEWYVLGGYSYVWGQGRTNALDANGNAYTWPTADPNTGRVDKSVRNSTFSQGQSNSIFAMKSGDNQKYETEFTNRNGNHDDVVGGGPTLKRHAADLGFGVAFRVSSHFNIGIEQKFTYVFDNGDFSDVVLGPTQRADLLSNTQVRFNFNLGNKSKRVEPLWWVNPNNYLYDRVLAIRDNKLVDSDGDGVPDQFDLEPNTPAGCPVDTHGRSLDTDGDGVPDCRDKQKITPPNWFPVDADGVGTEPTPACCKEKHDVVAPPPTCAVTSLPSVHFNKGLKLNADAKSALNTVVAQLNSNPNCKVKLVGYGAGNKRAQQLSYDRVATVKKFLIEQGGVAEGRIIFTYGNDGDVNTVDLIPTMEDGPSSVPNPHPELSQSK